MAGRSSQADNRGSSLFGLLASGKGRKFHTFRDAASASDPTGHTATGGVISDYTDPGPGTVYRSHVFTTTGTFNVTALDDNYPSTVEFLLVAGGGGGGTSNNGAHGGNGGGGGGGYVEGNAIPVTSTTTFTVSIGGGGQAIGQPTLIPAPSRSGSDSTISGPTITTITAKGGGGGGEDGGDTVSPGGSGGGSWGGGGQGPTTFGSATQPGTNSLYGATDYGNAGGKRPGVAAPAYCGSGGGGAGGAGGDAGNPASTGGTGGNGRASTIAYGPANPVSYAGGGGGGNTPYGGNNAGGAPGGGGAAGSRGGASTGGGGGGNPSLVHLLPIVVVLV